MTARSIQIIPADQALALSDVIGALCALLSAVDSPLPDDTVAEQDEDTPA